ncbi:hypothetical protein LINPERHAP2_LOCUS24172 [Linum perenne]
MCGDLLLCYPSLISHITYYFMIITTNIFGYTLLSIARICFLYLYSFVPWLKISLLVPYVPSVQILGGQLGVKKHVAKVERTSLTASEFQVQKVAA